jgi:hypothetical protein
MGWQDTQPTDPRFEETVTYKRFDWDILNPAEGVYDWSAIEAWRRIDSVRGSGQFSFRIRTARPPPWGEGQAMPAWLVERGAQIQEGDSDEEGVRSTEPLYAGCLFLEAHGQFVDALRQKYDGDPDLAFIDIGSYGTYGEWDSEQYDDEPGSLDWHARRRIIDMYVGGRGTRPCLDADGKIRQVSYTYTGFQDARLVMPYTPWFSDSLTYALNRRLDIGIRHDALGSEKHQDRYEEEIGALVEQRWPLAPIVFEFTSKADTPAALHRARDFARKMHASFIHDNLGGHGQDDLIEAILADVGYRLVLHEMTYTSQLGPGEILSFEMAWENTGAAPPYYVTYPLVVSLTDSQGIPLLGGKLESDIREWLPGQPVELHGTLKIPGDFPAGEYALRMAFVDRFSGEPALNLAIAGRDEQGHYVIGPVEVVN